MAICALVATLALASFGLTRPVIAAEQCVAHSIDAVGRCHQRNFARRVTDDQLRGKPDLAQSAPVDIDANLLATELAGELSIGQWFPVDGATDQWMLVVKRGEIGLAPGFAVQEQGGPNRSQFLALVQIARSQGTDKPVVRLKAKIEDLVGGTSAVQLSPEAPPTAAQSVAPPVPCVDPEGDKGSEYDSSGGYPQISGQFRWLTLSPGHRVLVAGVSRSEGYAGGGGMFEGNVLLEQRGDRLVPIACHARSRYQMFGGDWNPDGTRQHPESQAEWRLTVRHGSASNQARWPDLGLVPLTSNTPAATLVWDRRSGFYVEGHGQVAPRKKHRATD